MPTSTSKTKTSLTRVKPSSKLTLSDRLSRLKELLADYNSVGITSIVDANADQRGVELYQALLAKNALTCRTFLAFGVDAKAPLDRIEAAIKDVEEALKGDNKDAIGSKTQAMMTASQKLGEKMYASMQGDQAGAAAAAAGAQTEGAIDKAKESDVVDADYKEVKRG